jgi:hypothetical protein
MAFLCALFAVPMDKAQLAIYQACTGRKAPPLNVARLAYLICGRRAGKSFILALVAVFIACFHSFTEFLNRGERATVMIVAADRRQARIILRYIRALLKEVPLLHRMVQRETAESFDLRNKITIEVATASMKSVRGYAIACALLDEVAFFENDEQSASPDREILNAIKPATLQFPNAMILIASSPYARKGILWEGHRDHFGKEGDPVLCWQAATTTMNPTIPQEEIDAAYEADPASASAEYGAQFRSDVEAFVSLDAVMACVSDGIYERAREAGVRYSAFVDVAGGTGKDSFSIAVASKRNEMSVLHCLREWKPPFNPESVIEECCKLLRTYDISRVTGDRYAGGFPPEAFRKHHIEYIPSEKSKSDIYITFLPMVNSKTVDLLDNKRLVQQLIGLERRTARSGKDSVDHGFGLHDDIANATAGAIILAGTRKYKYRSDLDWIDDGTEESASAWKMNELLNHMSTPQFGGNRGRRY